MAKTGQICLCATAFRYAQSLVEDGTEHGDRVMSEKRSAFIELKPPNDAMLSQIFAYAGFRDPEMFGEL